MLLYVWSIGKADHRAQTMSNLQLFAKLPLIADPFHINNVGIRRLAFLADGIKGFLEVGKVKLGRTRAACISLSVHQTATAPTILSRGVKAQTTGAINLNRALGHIAPIQCIDAHQVIRSNV